MGSKYLFVKRTPLRIRLLKWGASLILLMILWPSVLSSLQGVIEMWPAPTEPAEAAIITTSTREIAVGTHAAGTATLSKGAQVSSAKEDSDSMQPIYASNDQTRPAANTSTTSTPTATAPLTPEPAGEAGLRTALQQWLQAWKTRDLTTYLALYSQSFAPPQGINRDIWAETRRARILSKQKIELSILNLSVQIQGNTATVKFTQVYADERIRMTDRKTMVWQQADGRWLILSETAD